MTNKINDGGAAFPRPSVRAQTREGIYCENGKQGMTLRAFIATQIMAGTSSNPEWTGSPQHRASHAVELADALIAELAKEQP